MNWPITKICLAYLSPLWFATARIGLRALCQFALLAMQGRLLWSGRRELGILISLGGVAVRALGFGRVLSR